MQVAGSVQPCAHAKVNAHAGEHWHTPVMQDCEAHSAFAEQTAPGTFFVHRRSAPMAVHVLVLHIPFSVQPAPSGCPIHFLLEQMLDTQ